MLAIAAAFALGATACGSGDTNDVAADASSAGVANNFCDAVADLGVGLDEGATPASSAADAAAALELMPKDAPDFAIAYFNAVSDSTRLAASSASDSADGVEADSAWANGPHLQVSAFLGSQCPGQQYTALASFQGMVSMGMSMQSSETGQAATIPTTDTDTSESPSTTLANSGSTDETSDDLAAQTGSAVRTDLSDGGQSVVYSMTEFSVGPAFASNADQYEIFDSAAEGTNQSWVVVEINGETLANITTSYTADAFFLVDPNGQTMNAEQFNDRFGESVYDLGFNGKENKSAFALFNTPNPVTDLTGWQIQILIGDSIPAFIPLSGESAPAYVPIGLEPGPGGSTTGPNLWEACTSLYDIEVVEANIGIEATYNNRLNRSRIGERFVTIEVDVTNSTEDANNLPCGDGAASGLEEQHLRLVVDGRTTSTEDLAFVVIEQGTTEAVWVSYIIPSDATDLQLIGAEETEVFATWSIDIPALPGE